MPTKDIDFMDVDSDSDISLQAEQTSRSKAKGKGKVVPKSKKAKGKSKANDVSAHNRSILGFISVFVCVPASIYMGGFVYALLGYCPGG